MGFGVNLLRNFGIPESVLWLPPKSALHIICLCSDHCASAGQVNGGDSPQEAYPHSHDKLVVFAEPGAIQHERARLDHHICQLGLQFCLCCEHHHHSEGLLPQEHAPSCGVLVISYHPGESFVPPPLNSLSDAVSQVYFLCQFNFKLIEKDVCFGLNGKAYVDVCFNFIHNLLILFLMQC